MANDMFKAGLRFRDCVLSQGVPAEQFSALVRDLCSDQPNLKPALLDLVGRTLFGELPFNGSSAQQSLARDRLLEDLQPLYRLEILEQLMDFIEGALGYVENAQLQEQKPDPDSAWQGVNLATPTPPNRNDNHQLASDPIMANPPESMRPAFVLEGVSVLLSGMPMAARFAASLLEGFIHGSADSRNIVLSVITYCVVTYWYLSMISTLSTRSPMGKRQWLGLTSPAEILGGLIFAYADLQTFFQMLILLATASWLVVAIPVTFLSLL